MGRKGNPQNDTLTGEMDVFSEVMVGVIGHVKDEMFCRVAILSPARTPRGYFIACLFFTFCKAHLCCKDLDECLENIHRWRRVFFPSPSKGGPGGGEGQNLA